MMGMLVMVICWAGTYGRPPVPACLLQHANKAGPAA